MVVDGDWRGSVVLKVHAYAAVDQGRQRASSHRLGRRDQELGIVREIHVLVEVVDRPSQGVRHDVAAHHSVGGQGIHALVAVHQSRTVEEDHRTVDLQTGCDVGEREGPD